MSKRLGVLPAVLLMAVAGMGQKTTPKAEKATYSINGSVVDADGQSLSNVEIYLGRLPAGAVGAGQESLLSSPAGRFRFTGLSPGKYGVLAAKKGFVAQSYGMREGYVIGIAVGPGMGEPEVILRLKAEGSIAGVVRNDDDVPLRGAAIWLFRLALEDGLQHTFKAEQTVSDERGAYRFSHLPPGKYYLAVKAENEFSSYLTSAFFVQPPDIREIPESGNAEPSQYRLPPELDVAYPVTFYPDASKATNAQNLDLHAGEKLHADFRLQAARAIHLKIPSDTQATLRMRTFEDEEMEIGGVPIPSGAAEWRTLAVAPGKYSVVMDFCTQEVCIKGGPELELTADTTIDHDQIVDHTATISGTAIRDDGSPLSPDLGVMLIPLYSISPARRIPLMIGDGGTFSWSGELPPARYTLELGDPALSIKSLTVDGAKVRGKTIEPRGSGLLSFALVLTSNSSRVQGKVVSAGNPVAGAMVLLVPQDFESNMQLFRRDESDSDGTFGLPPVAPGRYIAIALEHGWDLEWARPEALKPYLMKGKPVKLTSGATADITLELQ